MGNAGSRVLAVACAVAAFVGIPAWAQQELAEERAVLHLFFSDSEVVSPSKFDQKLSQAPAKVVIVTAEQIRQRGYVDLEQVLHDLAGFDFDKGMGVNWSTIFMRGIRSDNSDRFLLIWDGIIQNDIWKQTTWISRQYPLSNIARIEVLYGPASLLYGANAFAGIINVILKKEAEVDGFSIQAMVGSWRTQLAEFNFGKEAGPWRFMANARYYTSDEMDFNGKYWVDAAGRRRTYNHDLALMWPAAGRLHDWNQDGLYDVLINGCPNGFDGKTHNPTNDWFVQAGVGWGDFDLRGYYWWQDEAEDPWYTSQKRSNDHLIITGSALELTYAHDFGNGLKSRGYLIMRTSGVNENTRTPSFKAYFTGDVNDPRELCIYKLGSYVYYKVFAREYRLGAQFDLARGDTMAVMGAELVQTDAPEDYATRTLKSQPWSATERHRTRDAAAFANVHRALGGRFSLDAGLRYDYNYAVGEPGGFGGLFTGRAAAIATPTPNQTVKLIYGQSFQEPDPWHRYSLDVGVRNLRAPDLQPEKLDSLELDYDVTVGTRWRTSFSLYANRVRNLIRLESVSRKGGATNQFKNIGELDVRGLELESRYFFGEGRSAYLNATWTRAEDPKTGRKTGDIAPFKANAGLELAFEKGSLSCRAHYVSARDTINYDNPSIYVVRKVGSYFTVDLTGVLRVRQDLDVTFSLWNLLDRTYYDPGPRSADGTSYNGAILQQPFHAFVGLSYRF